MKGSSGDSLRLLRPNSIKSQASARVRHPVSRLIDLPGSTIGGFQSRLLPPGHLRGIGSGEMNAAAGTSRFRPEPAELSGLVCGALAHAGPGIPGPVMDDHL